MPPASRIAVAVPMYSRFSTFSPSIRLASWVRSVSMPAPGSSVTLSPRLSTIYTSLPRPPSSASLPAPPSSVSLPRAPTSVSAPALPTRLSAKSLVVFSINCFRVTVRSLKTKLSMPRSPASAAQVPLTSNFWPVSLSVRVIVARSGRLTLKPPLLPFSAKPKGSARRSRLSSPLPPSKVSSPLPAVSRSLPVPPLSRSLPVPPSSVSSPPPPSKVSAPSKAFSSSAPSLPLATSLPASMARSAVR